MTNKFNASPYRPGDEEEIVQLLELVFNGWPQFDLNCTPLDHWRWKYLDNPLRLNILYSASFDNKIIGCTHTIPQRVKVGDKIFLSGTGADVAVHPDFRRRGIHNKIVDSKLDFEAKIGIKFHYGISNNPILIKRNMRRGFPLFPHDVSSFIRIYDVDLHLRMIPTKYAWIKKYGYQLLKIYNKLRNALRSYSSSDHDFHISVILNFDDRINTFWNKIKDNYSLIVERKQNYLNWRYCDPRGGDYTVIQAEKDGHVLGYGVLRINMYRGEYPVGHIVDLLTIPERLDVAGALVEHAVIYFDKKDINTIQCLSIKNHPYERILNRYGFINSRKKLNIFYQYYEGISENLKQVEKSSENKIHFAIGDYDAI